MVAVAAAAAAVMIVITGSARWSLLMKVVWAVVWLDVDDQVGMMMIGRRRWEERRGEIVVRH